MGGGGGGRQRGKECQIQKPYRSKHKQTLNPKPKTPNRSYEDNSGLVLELRAPARGPSNRNAPLIVLNLTPNTGSPQKTQTLAPLIALIGILW